VIFLIFMIAMILTGKNHRNHKNQTNHSSDSGLKISIGSNKCLIVCRITTNNKNKLFVIKSFNSTSDGTKVKDLLISDFDMMGKST
jgi:hypothetical protein